MRMAYASQDKITIIRQVSTADHAVFAQNITVGIDEAGRGPLAGPVVAAAVVLDPAQTITGLADSKALSAKKRAELAPRIKQQALGYGIGQAEPAEIDQINILQASFLAMQRAVAQLPKSIQDQISLALIDGNRAPQLPYPCVAIIKGDGQVPAIMAAGILAKTTRDAAMLQLDQRYPGYGFAQHKGYPTKAHKLAIQHLGLSPVHRKSFS